MLPTDSFDLGAMRMHSGEGRRLELAVAIDPYQLGGERYAVAGGRAQVRLDVSRTTGSGWALRLRFQATLAGPCVRCLQDTTASLSVDAREVSLAGSAEEELDSPYVQGGVLDLRAWARDALALTLPAKLLCRPDCAGLCPVCGIDLNEAPAEHHHERSPDPRWARLSELRFD
jgi:uncharacterized protein